MFNSLFFTLLISLLSFPIIFATANEDLSPHDLIEKNLRHPVIIYGDSNNRMSLSSRMAYYDVPGLSIAVIDNGKITWPRLR